MNSAAGETKRGRVSRRKELHFALPKRSGKQRERSGKQREATGTDLQLISSDLALISSGLHRVTAQQA